jgi:small neutral amino acid transporter SnatA (MarC family)
LLTRLLHFSTGALAVAGGIVLLIIAVSMVLGLGDGTKAETSATEKEPMQLAVFPLAIPYLLNPVGIVVLVTVSAEAASIARVGLIIGVIALVLALDVVVFRWANKVSERLDESRLLVTEKVFGFLLAALAVQLVLTGLDAVGAIHLTEH